VHSKCMAATGIMKPMPAQSQSHITGRKNFWSPNPPL
jgi:hypothetical protein